MRRRTCFWMATAAAARAASVAARSAARRPTSVSCRKRRRCWCMRTQDWMTTARLLLRGKKWVGGKGSLGSGENAPGVGEQGGWGASQAKGAERKWRLGWALHIASHKSQQ